MFRPPAAAHARLVGMSSFRSMRLAIMALVRAWVPEPRISHIDIVGGRTV